MIKITAARFKFFCIFLFVLCFLSFNYSEEFYWDIPKKISPKNGQFLKSAYNDKISAVAWEEAVIDKNGKTAIYISAAVYADGKWIVQERISDPIYYVENVPSVVSIAVAKNNNILITAIKNRNTISFFKSTDEGQSFIQKDITMQINDLLSPYLCVSASGKYLLFVSHGINEKFSIFSSVSNDGFEWSPFSELEIEKTTDIAFLPVHVAVARNDVIVFQAVDIKDNRRTYSLFSSYSSDGGLSWSEPVNLTPDLKFQNQRPDILYLRKEKRIAVVWERSPYQSKKNEAVYATLDTKGGDISEIEEIPKQIGSVLNPKIILHNKLPFIAWTSDNSGRGNLFIAVKQEGEWKVERVRTSEDAILFVCPVSLNKHIQLLWQEGSIARNIMYVSPDDKIDKPKLTPVNFGTITSEGRQKIIIKIHFPYDSSGVAGYSYKWSKDAPPDFVEPQIQNLSTEATLVYEPEEDGLWYVGVRSVDYAGNWSDIAVVSYERDIVPPEAPKFDLFALDNNGFLKSNTFAVKWFEPEFDINGKLETQIKGFIWNIDYVDNIQNYKMYLKNSGLSSVSDEDVQKLLKNKFKTKIIASNINTVKLEQRFNNYENGVYAFSIAAVDDAGNIGDVSVKYFALNKYKPFTYVSNIEFDQAKDGLVSMSVVGRGFFDGGKITNIYIDKDGHPPYDLVLTENQFDVLSDRLISNIKISDLEKGNYRVGLFHPQRGVYFTSKPIGIDDYGNVKFGDYGSLYNSVRNWNAVKDKRSILDIVTVIIILICITFVVVISGFIIRGVLKEAGKIKNEVNEILNGGLMGEDKKHKVKVLKVRSGGLRFKFTLFIVSLIIFVVLILSNSLGIQFLEQQETLLVESLATRANIFLESLTSSAKAYLPSKNVLELGLLQEQISSFDEVEYITITGTHMQNKKTGYNFVWTSNDLNLKEKIDTPEFIVGESDLYIPELKASYEYIDSLNNEAKKRLGELITGISSLTKDAIEIALKTDKASIDKRNDIQAVIRQMEEKMNIQLSALSAKGEGSYPEFNPKKLSRDVTDFLFYKPVFYGQSGNSEQFVHGMVYLKVSTKLLLSQIEEAESSTRKTILYLSLLSTIIGTIGAYILGSIIIYPIKNLVSHIELINTTEDKSRLAGVNVAVRTKDEIGVLGKTINDMTEGLAAAAVASKDLTLGKEIQKRFLPLDVDESGRKLTCGKLVDGNVEFFGYYEGAKGVSGDYFNYLKLDDRYYAIIKCDVAGKGIPAALIMVEVATLFLDYFKDWNVKKDGISISSVVSRINDLIESLGFKGRFAAFTLCLFDTVTGDVHFCNAGDNIVNIYDSASKKMKEVTLTEVSAAGVFPTFMIDMKGGFKVETVHLNSGDVLFLYTDGIEEAKRLFRDELLRPIVCEEPGLAQDEEHETHTVGQDGEELGKERVCKIIESVFTRKPYSLTKWHNPIPNEQFDFDFTKADGSLEDAVLGLVSVEKVFRMYQDSNAVDTDSIIVDKKIDLFLNKYFRQYQTYCCNRRPNNEYNEYLYYTNVKEDEQYDDLTILGIKKK